MINWIRKKIQKFLRIDQLDNRYYTLKTLISKNTGSIIALQKLNELGVDVHFRTPSKIYILSKLKGGQIREIPIHKEMTIKELEDFVKELKYRFQIDQEAIVDLPYGYPREMFRW